MANKKKPTIGNVKPRQTLAQRSALTKKRHAIFINEYLNNNKNGKQAYKIAYPECKDKSAEAGASRLLCELEIQREITNKLQGYSEILTKDRLLHELNSYKELDKARVADMIKATETQSKIMGHYTDNNVALAVFNGGDLAELTATFNSKYNKL